VQVIEEKGLLAFLITKKDIMNATIDRILQTDDRGMTAEKNATDKLIASATRMGTEKGYNIVKLLTRDEAVDMGLKVDENVVYVLIMQKGGVGNGEN